MGGIRLVDKSLILRKFSELEGYLKQIKEFSSISLDNYSGDWKVQRIVERTLQMMIEICADVANHIIADKECRFPTSYADTFRVLAEEKVIEVEVCKIMVDMSRFRNIIVHHYNKIDDAIVVDILRKHLDDFIIFKDAIVKFLNKEGYESS